MVKSDKTYRRSSYFTPSKKQNMEMDAMFKNNDQDAGAV